MAPNHSIVLFNYSFSPYGKRILWYLTLRGIKFSICVRTSNLAQPQPEWLPRHDISALGLAYRRIPILSIGRDIFFDTRLILDKLEELLPNGRLGASVPEQRGTEKLLEKWLIDGGIFTRAGQLIPLDTPILREPEFGKDRADYSGKRTTLQEVIQVRPEATADIREAFDLLETTFFADGRTWILSSDQLTLADIHGIWCFWWLHDMKTALPPSLISKQQYPNTFAWIDHFAAAVSLATTAHGKAPKIDGAEALKQILAADFAEPHVTIDEADPTGLKLGQEVEIWPTDTGSNHHDRGRLVGLSLHQVVIECQTTVAGQVVRAHAPRHGFRIQAVSDGPKSFM
ncbi:MAG: hypothetical protein M1838_005308 [Thelocarpon superellum]|nr:MAG: hypothetical protein M1838_005308 [Thelocarpon superellum]